MEKINFVNNQAPYINADNLNAMQDNIENAFGEIIESGSNSNGNYIKYSDGTMICWHTIQGSTFNCTQSAGTGRYYYIDTNNSEENHKTWTYPISFKQGTVPTVSTTVGSNAFTMPSTGGSNYVYSTGYCVTPYAVDNLTFTWNFIAIGKWK